MLGWLFLTLFASEIPPVWQTYRVPSMAGIEILQTKRLPLIFSKEKSRVLPQEKEAAWAVYDVHSGTEIIGHNMHKQLPIASLTKLMTAQIILRDHELDEVVQIPLEAVQTEGVKGGFYAYEKVTIKTLLQAILIGSANDAARSLAIHNAGSEKEFATKMNLEAQYLGLKSAHFYNSTGLDVYPTKTDNGQIKGNLMSARDISILVRLLIRNDFVRETVNNETWYGASVDGKFEHYMETTNDLLSQENIKGFKTGYTLLAKQCFVSLVEQDKNEYITIVLGSKDRFGQTQKIINWMGRSVRW
jgi:D-alanyl-D-alanine carboxypeptidase (penicillin-binding protein 5/6)